MYGAASTALAALGAWLLYLSPRQRAVRALSAALILMALAFADDVINSFLTLDQQLALFPYEVIVYAGIGLSTLYFLSVYPRSRGWLGRSRHAGWGILAALALLAVIVALFPSLTGEAAMVDGEFVVTPGPFAFLYNAWSLTSGALMVLLALDYRRARPGTFRRSLILVLAGYLASALAYHTSLILNDVLGLIAPFAGPRQRLAYALEEIVFFPAVAAVGIVLWHGLRSSDASTRREAQGFGVAVALATAAAVLATLLAPPPAGPGEWTSDAQGIVDALGALALSGFAGYALLKHRLFDIDVKLRWTISRGAMAAVFLAIFFVAAQLAQNFLSDSYGWAIGGVIAGIMLFAIAPIQRMAERFANVAVPLPAGAAAAPHERRSELYRLALALALSDRIISRDEERHLARVAEELGLGHSEALALREQMERELGVGA